MEFNLPTGAKIQITVAPFADAHALLKAIMRSVKGMDFPQSILDTDMSLAGAMGNPQLLSKIIDKILSIAVSDEVEQALFKCMERATYNGLKIDRRLFDDPNVTESLREDYYSICFKVIEANCKPFFKKTFSELSALTQAPTDAPK